MFLFNNRSSKLVYAEITWTFYIFDLKGDDGCVTILVKYNEYKVVSYAEIFNFTKRSIFICCLKSQKMIKNHVKQNKTYKKSRKTKNKKSRKMKYNKKLFNYLKCNCRMWRVNLQGGGISWLRMHGWSLDRKCLQFPMFHRIHADTVRKFNNEMRRKCNWSAHLVLPTSCLQT